MTRLIVAAGGGGDAVAAAMLHAALYGAEDQAVILTYAWDRLLVDPVPGPRGTDNFTGLKPLTSTVRAVPAEARPIAPAGSTLPRLAAELPHTIALIDPHHGVEGITHQLEELVEHLAPESIDLLDVGGDILARGDEPTLKSPLADAVTLAACCQVNATIRLLVAGPGLDGELPLDDLRSVLGPLVHTFTTKEVEPIGSVLEWHPSEATGMLAATARGIRGTCEMRDAGLPVPLTDEGPTVHEVDLDEALNRNQLARAILTTATLDEAEAHSREICGYSEIDYERNKAAWLKDQPPAQLVPETVLSELDQFEAEAQLRGVTHTTFRRITEALNLNGSLREDLRQLLINSRPEQYDAPLWRITTTPE
ncbi:MULTISPECIES: DUF1152 domain-containing protein [Streptomyces]|uniref:DUF1152 domain-containing protein n=1 Tax=Streptomyces koelreuteriae TaxID=2838015 RepID=A0ABX8FT88_9ACTN|nr:MULTISPECIES: DUF1152 domain-containing protein [Streptomyces]QWB24225.1 DUF1152 domain-containing protein [Streptomyces koelreuteriae]UUA07222.1 DUF1152 domain-containing protein [Streptomyces koelreuteriae]UUA14851.1 DUF1152 domain-containing protein [Streptomyces sp. CRCS-T-1]